MSKKFLQIISVVIILSLALSGCTFIDYVDSFEIEEEGSVITTRNYDIYDELISNIYTREYYRTDCREIRHTITELLRSAYYEGSLYFAENESGFSEGRPAVQLRQDGKPGIWYITEGDKSELIESQLSSFIVTSTREEITVNECCMYERSEDGTLWYEYNIVHDRIIVDLRPTEILSATITISDANSRDILYSKNKVLSGEETMQFYASLKVRYKDMIRSAPGIFDDPTHISFLQPSDLSSGAHAIGFYCTGATGIYYGRTALFQSDSKGIEAKIAQDIKGLFEIEEFTAEENNAD